MSTHDTARRVMTISMRQLTEIHVTPHEMAHEHEVSKVSCRDTS